MTPLFIMVGADKGGVGKTTVARILLDFLDATGVKSRSFDTESPEGDLRRFRKSAEVVDISKVGDQMKVFDAPPADAITVIDIRAGLLSPTLKALNDAGMLEDVKKGLVEMVILHVLGSSVSSLNEIVAASKALGGSAKHLLVKNTISENGLGELGEDPRYVELLKKMEAVTVNVPQLTDIACQKIQQTGCSFTEFARDADEMGKPSPNSRMLRGYVKSWMQTVWCEFQRVGLDDMVKKRAG